MAYTLTPYNNLTAADIIAKASDVCDYAVNGSNVNCTNVKLTKIKSVLGSTYNNLGSLCAESKVNKFSGYSPREWNYGGGVITDAVTIPYRMHTFCGYNHNALSPHVAVVSQTVGPTQGYTNVSMSGHFNLGEVNWESEIGANAIRIYINDTEMYLYDSSNYTANTDVNFDIVLQSPAAGGTDNYTAKLVFVHNDTDRGELVSARGSFYLATQDSIDLAWTAYTYDGDGYFDIDIVNPDTHAFISNLVSNHGADESNTILNITSGTCLRFTLDPNHSQYAHISINGNVETAAQDATLVRYHTITNDLTVIATADDIP